MNYPNGILFDEKLTKELKEKFYCVDTDEKYGKRLFFENSGGSLRLKKCVTDAVLSLRAPHIW